jgi:hypothetical protein
MLFAFPLAIAVPIIGAILLGGPMLGFPVAAVVAIVVVGSAIRKTPAQQRAATPREPGWPVAATARRFAAPAAILVAGAVMIVVFAGTARIIGAGVIAVGLTLALSVLFLEVGYSEDRARAQEQRRRGRMRPPGARPVP